MQVPQKCDLSDDSHLHENMYFICVYQQSSLVIFVCSMVHYTYGRVGTILVNFIDLYLFQSVFPQLWLTLSDLIKVTI
jgi:hypothetical protein